MFSPRPTPIRSVAISRLCATICAAALALLREAGYEIRDTKLINTKTNEQLSVELLVSQPAFERVVLVLQAVAGAPRHRRVGADGR